MTLWDFMDKHIWFSLVVLYFLLFIIGTLLEQLIGKIGK